MLKRLSVLLVVGVTATAGTRAGAQDPAPVPVFEEPRHHLVYDAPALRILDIQIPPGDTTLFHTHNSAMLYVPVASSTTRSQVLGEAWSGGGTPAPAAAPPAQPARPGRVNAPANYVEKPVTHRVNNVGSTLFRLIGIANRTAGAEGTADNVSGLSENPEVENRWYRAHRVVLEAQKSSGSHRHATTVVIVMQTAGTAAVEGSSWSPLNGQGDFVWQPPGSHVVHNRGGSPIEFVEIEVRGAAK